MRVSDSEGGVSCERKDWNNTGIGKEEDRERREKDRDVRIFVLFFCFLDGECT